MYTNFHADIALRLEHNARDIMGYSDRPGGTIFDADGIDGGHFAEVMVLLLRVKSDYERSSEIDAFVTKCIPYYNVRGAELPKETVEELYAEFKQILASL